MLAGLPKDTPSRSTSLGRRPASAGRPRHARLRSNAALNNGHALLGQRLVVTRAGTPAGFDKTIYKRRSEVERTIDRLKNFRAVATRYDERAYVFHGTVAAIRLWPRP
ncbi:transposase [Streptomyces sp. NPDC056352]|uniref:transposase n=1 Tax=Streptomyces sp. NPDC056352 TaxID=3345791 RepID=UPI0035D6CB90